MNRRSRRMILQAKTIDREGSVEQVLFCTLGLLTRKVMMTNTPQIHEQDLPWYHKPKAICKNSECGQSTIKCGEEEPKNSQSQLFI